MNALTRNAVQVSGEGERMLVFGNGFGTDQRAWRFVAPAFAGQRRVVNFDHVGFGSSDRAAYAVGRHDSLDGYAQDLLDILDALAVERVDYVGHSIAGIIGLLAAARAPERFGQLVLIGSSPRFVNDPPDYVGGFSREDVEGILDAMERDQLAWSQSLAPVAMGEQSSPDLIHEFGNGLSALDPYIARAFGRLVFLVDARDRLARVRTPALVLQCTHDSIVPVEVGAYLHRHLAGSTLRELEAAGHCPHLTHPAETITVIAQYLGLAGV
jgi:sigma-B regulation protein RsbQ